MGAVFFYLFPLIGFPISWFLLREIKLTVAATGINIFVGLLFLNLLNFASLGLRLGNNPIPVQISLLLILVGVTLLAVRLRSTVFRFVLAIFLAAGIESLGLVLALHSHRLV
ncbi:MAG: hypothetical protein H7095_07490 [Pseudopedobacter sp.]|nr:hypothetical protein [Deinococcales bacterium]